VDLATFTELLEPAGQRAIADAGALAPTEATFLTAFEKLRKRHSPAVAKAALETVLLRTKARAKFTSAERMYFTREALEQSSGEIAARHRAKRFAGYGVVADLGCGIGGDALALASVGVFVHAVDRDSVPLAMARANATALGVVDRIRFEEADVLHVALPDARAAFTDPSRRTDRRRYLDPEDYSPPLSTLRSRFAANFPLAVKIAPGVSWGAIGRLDAEVEFVSVEGELKECILWFGPLRSAGRRATILPSGVTLSPDHSPPLPPLSPVRAFVYDPDPAVVRAGLAGELAELLEIEPIDETVQLFTSDDQIDSPFLTVYRIEMAARYHATALRQHLRGHGVGRVTIVKRGSMIDADELMGKLKLAGWEHRVVLLTRAAGEPVMIVGERLTASSA
jgi:hypothetical protein